MWFLNCSKYPSDILPFLSGYCNLMRTNGMRRHVSAVHISSYTGNHCTHKKATFAVPWGFFSSFSSQTVCTVAKTGLGIIFSISHIIVPLSIVSSSHIFGTFEIWLQTIFPPHVSWRKVEQGCYIETSHPSKHVPVIGVLKLIAMSM